MNGAGVPAHILTVLPLMSSVRGGGPVGSQFDIPPGTIDRKSSMMILGSFQGETYYAMKTEIRAAPTGEFLQGYFIGEVASDVYRQTAWILPASRVLMAFTMGVAIGYVGALAVTANVVLLVTHFSSVLTAHPDEVQVLKETLPIVVRSLNWFYSNCPVLYSKLRWVIGKGALEALEAVPSGITAEDTANLLGRILGGIGNAPGAALGILAKIIAKTVATYTALHFPFWAIHGGIHRYQEIANAMADEFQRQSVNVTPQERVKIAEELMRGGEQARRNIDDLQAAMQRIGPALERISSSLATRVF